MGTAIFLGLALIAIVLIAIIIGYMLYGAFLGLAALARGAGTLWSELAAEECRTPARGTLCGNGQLAQNADGGCQSGQHCWDIKQCAPAIRGKCPAYAKPNSPCWLACMSASEDSRLRPECLACKLFNLTEMIS